MSSHSLIQVTDGSQVGEARRAAVRYAETTRLGETQRGRIAIIATELANNLVRHGTNGQLLIRALTVADLPTIELLAVDFGPGMPDVERCLQDGFSTRGTPGTGLGAIRRLSTEFDIYSSVPKGTVVLSRVSDEIAGDQRVSSPFSWGAISTPAPGEAVCGDAYRVIERGGELAVMVADGLGHGPRAGEASNLAGRVFENEGLTDPGELLEHIHGMISGTRGAAIAVGRAFSKDRMLRYAGIGNIAGILLSDKESRGLVSYNGTVGVQIRKAQALDYPWPERGLMVMHSDGLQTRWSFDPYPGLMARHPSVIAGVLWRDWGRGRDDTTVLVIRM